MNKQGIETMIDSEGVITRADLNAQSANLLPDYMGVVITRLEGGEVEAQVALQPHHMAPNGFLHAATVIALADSACGCGCIASLPDGAESFTTVELKSNHLGTAREGTITCSARAVHMGRTTQVWDAQVFHQQTGRTIAMYRCTQMLLYPRKKDKA